MILDGFTHFHVVGTTSILGQQYSAICECERKTILKLNFHVDIVPLEKEKPSEPPKPEPIKEFPAILLPKPKEEVKKPEPEPVCASPLDSNYDDEAKELAIEMFGGKGMKDVKDNEGKDVEKFTEF